MIKKKKIFGVIGISVMALSMFLNSAIINESIEIDLAALITFNKADAEAGCVGKKYLVVPRPGGGWNCLANSGLSCCPYIS